MEKDLLTAREVAARLRVCVRTVWNWNSCGELPPPFRLGRVTRWRTRDIEAYLVACQRRPPPRQGA